MMQTALMRSTLPAAHWSGAWPDSVAQFAIDTRRLAPGDVFVALPGSRVDGHQFLAAARGAGAVGAVVAQPQDDPLPQLQVPDPAAAMSALAAARRSAWSGQLVGLTGSNGKTTTKEMLAGIVLRSGPACVTQGNLNNHLGVPLTLLGLRDEHRSAVVEMGANHPGEIDQLAAIAQPDVALITMAGAAHLEGFGSLEGVARAKGEIYARLGAEGCAIINGDDQFAGLWRRLAGHCRQLSFGRDADVSYRNWQGGPERQTFELSGPGFALPIELHMPGAHNRGNALAAAAAALALGIEPELIAEGLNGFSPVAGRQQIYRLGACTLIDDSYNANPDSMRAAIAVLAAGAGPRLMCLGDMAELGHDAEALHAEIGAAARAAGIEVLWACGDLSAAAVKAFGPRGRHFGERSELIAALSSEWRQYAVTLVKGSRAAGMERVVQALRSGATTC